MQHQLFFRRSTYSFILLALIVVMGYTQTRAAETPRANETYTTINQSTAKVLQFDLHVAPVTFESSGALSIAGLEGRTADTGVPQLPFYRTHIGLPPESEITVSVVSNQSSKTDNVIVQPVPSVDIPDDVDRRSITSLEEFDLLYEEDAAIYESNQAYPNELFEVSEPFYIRDRRVVELTVYPVQYNPAAQSLLAHHSFSVSVAFEGGNMRGMQPVSSTSDAFGINILNGTQSAEWRARPRGLSTATSFPIGVETVKIEVNEDAIYELTHSDLAAFSSLINGNPNNFQMMHQGNKIAFEFVGNANEQFESGESIRFYGWAFDGTRAEKFHVENNVFWLWAGDAVTSPQMNTTANLGSGSTVLNSWESTIAFEENNYYLETNKRDWNSSDADAELWYWKFFRDHEITEFNLDLPHPTGAGTATYTSEIFASVPTGNPGVTQHAITTTLNSVAGSTLTWTGNELKIVSSNISGAQLVPGTNVLRLHSNSSRTNNLIRDDFHLNRITVTYDRAFAAVGNQLQFEIPAAGAHEVTVTNLSGVTAGEEVSVYDVTNRLTPTQINVVGDVDIASSSVRIGRENAANAKLIAGKPKSPLSTSAYTAETLEPSGGQGASWVIVAPEIFNATAQELATHRATHSGMSTFVADYEDVINQYGYGLAYPAALRSYFTHGLMTWTNALEYVVLAGDATNNPLGRNCNKNSADSSICPGLANTNWQDVSDINHIITDYQFVDLIVGAVPTDFSMMLLQNDSLTNHVADIMLGRLPAQTTTELNSIVHKIKLYDNHLANNTSYTNEMLWIADDTDAAGDFCADTTIVRDQQIPAGRFNHTTYCLDDYGGNTSAAKNTMRGLFLNKINNGIGVINYRGHGAPRNWGEGLISANDTSGLVNFNKPSVIISADCLDGYFTSMGEEALSELFISANNTGSAAHWSSVGLGFNADHTKLHKAFYTGLYEHNLSTIGAAIQYAKEDFISNNSNKEAEVYEFLLQGDPAMRLPGVQHNVYIPIVVR